MARYRPKHLARRRTGVKKLSHLMFYGMLAIINLQFASMNKADGLVGWYVFSYAVSFGCLLMFLLVMWKMPNHD